MNPPGPVLVLDRPGIGARLTSESVLDLARYTRVLGLVAVGSMAEFRRTPDEWSDHDFFVITLAGAQESLRQDLGWLPESERAELHLARVNDYRVLLLLSFAEEQLAHRMERYPARAVQVLRKQLESWAGPA